MYSYFYDAFLQDRKYERDLALLETRLTDLGIMGKITRLALFRDGVSVIRDEIEEGAQTLVAVGDDNTFRKAIEAVGDTRTVVGYLPMGAKGVFGELLGIPSGVAACDILSARLVQNIDVGEVNGRRFLHALEADVTDAVIACEDAYTVTVPGRASLAVRNLAFPDDAGVTDPTDGKLVLVVRQSRFSLFGKKTSLSKVPFKHAHIFLDKHINLLLDGGEKLQAKEFDIRAIPGRLRLVTGKTRKF
ncbi:MAG: diacylglycerol kinase family protein [Patescibacteria group bacterium]